MPWPCLAEPWPCPGRALSMSWQSPVHALAVPGRALAVPCPCPGRVLAVSWPCPGRALSMPWLCSVHALPMPWPCPQARPSPGSSPGHIPPKRGFGPHSQAPARGSHAAPGTGAIPALSMCTQLLQPLPCRSGGHKTMMPPQLGTPGGPRAFPRQVRNSRHCRTGGSRGSPSLLGTPPGAAGAWHPAGGRKLPRRQRAKKRQGLEQPRAASYLF